MGDQYLCLDQVKEDGKVPPPPPQTANAVPVVPPPPPPPPAATFVKVPAPPPGIQKDRDTEKTTVADKKSSRVETSVATAPETESEEKGGHPTLVRILIAVTNLIFLVVLCFWVLTLFTGLHIADVAFINNMFMG